MSSEFERTRSLTRARKQGDAATLIAALDDKIEARLAIKFLADIGATAAIPALVPLLGEPELQLRASAALSLGRLSAEEACSALVRMAEHDIEGPARACAIEALRGMPGDFTDLFASGLDDPDIRVRRTAVMGLMDSGRSDVIPMLRSARKRERWYSRLLYGKAIRRLKRSAR